MTIWEIDNAISDLIDPETGELLDFDKFEELPLSEIPKSKTWLAGSLT